MLIVASLQPVRRSDFDAAILRSLSAFIASYNRLNFTI